MDEDMKRIPERREIPAEETWDLSSLFPSDEAWSEALGEYEKMTEKLPAFKGTLASSAESLADWMDFSRDHDMLGWRLSEYANARRSEDERAEDARQMADKGAMAIAKGRAACTWAYPELIAILEADIEKFLEHPRLADYRMHIGRMLRYRPHILSEAEERIAALYMEGKAALSDARSALVDVDMSMDLGSIETDDGIIELTKDADWPTLMYESPNREIRRKIYEKNNAYRDSVKTTLASFMSGRVKLDVLLAKLRGYPSARAAALFHDNVGGEVFDNLIATVGENLEPLHRYYGLRRRALGLDDLRAYDLYMPLVNSVKRKTAWNEAVGLLSDALKPLGEEYVSTLRNGLLGRWVDRHPNQGKSFVPFCSMNYGSDPLIMIIYDENIIDGLVCLAHESGHAMHWWYSQRSNPFRNTFYSNFDGETASAFHEALLFRHMLKTAGDDRELRLFLLDSRVDFFIRSMYNCVMYAEFADVVHKLVEGGTPLTVDVLDTESRRLLAKYRGPEYAPDETRSLFRQFHSYFDIYVYATGTCAAMALADRVLGGGESERADYIAFLKSGGSRFPIDSLKLAGVDMSRPEPVRAACRVFAGLVDELERLL